MNRDLRSNKRFLDLTGKSFGRLLVKSFNSRINKRTLWNCVCKCGTESIAATSHLTCGYTKSCGCLKVGKIKHGESRVCGSSKEYRAWLSMKTRCTNPNFPKFRIYGARGIKICESWMFSFQNFLKDVGRAPTDSHSLDRIDVNGNYEPLNVRWATPKEQANNTRFNKFWEIDGVRLTRTAWALKIGMSRSSLRDRLKHGWSLRDALTTPPKNVNRKHLCHFN